MHYVLASDPLASWGQAAAIILSIYMFGLILIGLVFALLLMFAFSWVREKSELVKKLRPTVDSLNTAIASASSETLPATVGHDNRLVQAVHTVQSAQVMQKARDVQRQVDIIEKKVDQQTDRVAGAVIEFRARTVMVQGMLKAFFLPGLTKQKPRETLLLPAAPDSSTTISADGPGSRGESSNAEIAQVSEGAVRTDDAPAS